MRLFLRHAAGEDAASAEVDAKADDTSEDDFLAKSAALVEAECDEILLDQSAES